MRLLLLVPVICAAQPLTIPPIKTPLHIESQPVEITVWGTISPAPADLYRLSLTVDLGNFQENLTPILAAQLNRNERCGERLSVERAAITPSPPSAVLTAWVHYERYACAKAFGKEVIKRLAGGNGVIETDLTPSIAENHPTLTAQVRKIDADGSLGELLRSGALGDSLRKKIAASIESAIQKSANLKSALPPAMESVATLQTVQFADGGAGRLWLTITGELHLSAEQFRNAAQMLPH